ncbi:MFS transporter [Planctobacterium marinum]|uniref:Sugar transporter n=1 Tax=Planctobacterium marinum TaxID=1631968 RepID=A0AA48HSF9_9ALTE|nr:sugar transporter [Planctobacterium marinum]
MSDQIHYETAEQDKIPLHKKIIYGFGALVNNALADAMGRMMIVLNLGLGMSPTLAGLLGALPRLLDALTDPLMGYISDNTKSRWGRRRPYIFIGAILVGIVFAVLWQLLPEGESEDYYFWVFLAGSIVFYLAYTIFATPWVALGYELTPDYHERTRLMGVQSFMGYSVYMVTPWVLWFMQNDAWFDNIMEGAASLAMIVGAFAIFVGILPAIFLKEKITAPVGLTPQESKSMGIKDFFSGFLATIKFKPFLCLCAATFLVFNGFMMVSNFQAYVIIYYVFGGDQALGSEYTGYAGTLSAAATFFSIAITSWLATKIGKRRAFFWAIGVSAVGYGLKWFCYNPEIPWLLLVPMPLLAFGLGPLFALMGSMIADVCDMDELERGERREGMFGSIFWWVVKLGMAAALAMGGVLLTGSGFDVELGSAQTEQALFWMRFFDAFLPMIFSLIAIFMVYLYPITEEKAHQIREELEARRGVKV